MSMLLEALRKSEQRQQARAVPGINSGMPVYSLEQPHRHRSLVWLVVPLVAAGVALAAWYWWPQAEVLPAPPGLAAAGPDGGQAPAPELIANAEVEPAAAARPRPQPASPVASLPETNSAQARAAPAKPTPTSAPNRAARQRGQAAQEAVPETLAQPASRPAPQPAPAEPRQPQPISYWALPEAVRTQLPDMKISVLVFADEPADRFVLMNGQRLVEGAQLQEGLSLEQVRREGVVMQFRKYRFLVKHN
jgi:general secretion pathway protein B